MMLQLDPPLPVLTPKGEALAHVLIDYGAEHHLLWVCFQADGECWTWQNHDIRATKNITMGRRHDGIFDTGTRSEPVSVPIDTGGAVGTSRVASWWEQRTTDSASDNH